MKTMEKENVTILVTLPKDQRDTLRRMAAERNLMNPDQVTTAAGLAREIISEFLNTRQSAQEDQEGTVRGQ
jgi:hypothetical protein